MCRHKNSPLLQRVALQLETRRQAPVLHVEALSLVVDGRIDDDVAYLLEALELRKVAPSSMKRYFLECE